MASSAQKMLNFDFLFSYYKIKTRGFARVREGQMAIGQMDMQTAKLTGTQAGTQAEIGMRDRWYIYRCRTLTNHIMDAFRDANVQVYIPCGHVKTVRKGQTEYLESPSTPGYIFVHAPLDQCIELARQLDIVMWKHRDFQLDAKRMTDPKPLTFRERESQYYWVRDVDMRHFMRAVEMHDLDVQVLDASNIDFQKDDRVVFLDGELKGVQGYLKTTQGKGGGVVVVPLNQDGSLRSTGICYTINAQPDELGIIAFASGNRHARDIMRSTQKVIDAAFASRKAGQPVTAAQRERLLGYVRRFSGVHLDTNIQKVNHFTLLDSIYQLLDMPMQRAEVQSQLDQFRRAKAQSPAKIQAGAKAGAEVGTKAKADVCAGASVKMEK